MSANIINVQDLQPGMVIVCVTKQNGPVRIKKSGLVTSVDMVQGLLEMGIQQVEIDPQQTVEIESAVVVEVKKSTTRKMLESNTMNSSRIDDHLSEQFNRSLFLPSVQDIPSAWQFYAKRCLLISLMVLGGFGFGWSMANLPKVMSFSGMPEQLPVTAIESQVAVEPATNETKKIVEPAIVQAITPLKDVIEQAPSVAPESNSVRTTDTAGTRTLGYVSERNEEPQISSKLLEKFNKALEQVSEDVEPIIPEPSEPANQVSRLDQLPAWVTTELPSMSFSAHMYASENAERWVRVNGTRMMEGDLIDNKVHIISIDPQHVILGYAGHEFSMPALSDW